MEDDYDVNSAQDMSDDLGDSGQDRGQKGGMANPTTMASYLSGVNYPASKQDLMDRASENGAPDEVLDALEKLPDQSYDNPSNVTEAMGNMM